MPLKVSRSPLHGHGCFATEDVAAGTCLEEERFLAFSPAETEALFRTKLKNYLFFLRDGDTPDGPYHTALVLGPISLCNHSPDPNCEFRLDEAAGCIRLTARRAIRPDEEITIDYGDYAEHIL